MAAGKASSRLLLCSQDSESSVGSWQLVVSHKLLSMKAEESPLLEAASKQ
jgi:hypothetical protein